MGKPHTRYKVGVEEEEAVRRSIQSKPSSFCRSMPATLAILRGSEELQKVVIG
jgi:hypothetical protein